MGTPGLRCGKAIDEHSSMLTPITPQVFLKNMRKHGTHESWRFIPARRGTPLDDLD